jgi:hypothetical protein
MLDWWNLPGNASEVWEVEVLRQRAEISLRTTIQITFTQSRWKPS